MVAVHPPTDAAILSATLFERGAVGPCLVQEALTRLAQA
jgi:hypothetical protein